MPEYLTFMQTNNWVDEFTFVSSFQMKGVWVFEFKGFFELKLAFFDDVEHCWDISLSVNDLVKFAGESL